MYRLAISFDTGMKIKIDIALISVGRTVASVGRGTLHGTTAAGCWCIQKVAKCTKNIITDLGTLNARLTQRRSKGGLTAGRGALRAATANNLGPSQNSALDRQAYRLVVISRSSKHKSVRVWSSVPTARPRHCLDTDRSSLCIAIFRFG